MGTESRRKTVGRCKYVLYNLNGNFDTRPHFHKFHMCVLYMYTVAVGVQKSAILELFWHVGRTPQRFSLNAYTI